MPSWLTWIIALLRGYFGIKADLARKEADETGEVLERNKDLAESVKDYRNELEIKSRPSGSDDDVIGRL